METWFAEVLKHSYRDQMSFNYVANKHGFTPAYFPGSLVANDLMKWLHPSTRVPRDFRDDEYLSLHPDVAESGMDPREHYLLVGSQQGRRWRIAD
jgi:hypothetical protein